MTNPRGLLLVVLFSLVFAGTCLAENMSMYALGVRYGTNKAADKKTDLHRYDVFGIFNLPWNWHLSSVIDLETRLIVSGGMLDGEGDAGFIGTLAPGISFTDRNKRISFEISGGIAVLPDYRLGEEDFGGPLQFIV
ncbi:MAG: acyloxyacyl hydrolase, partial [Deltaproteobacteria bacterium]